MADVVCMGTSSERETLLLTSSSHHLIRARQGMALAQQQAIPIGSLQMSPPCYLKAYISWSALQASGPPSLPTRAASRIPISRDQLWETSPSAKLEQLWWPPSPPPHWARAGVHKHVCRSHLQGSLNYKDDTHPDTLMPVVFGMQQLWRAAYHAASPSPRLQHKAWLARAAYAPHVCDLSRRPCCCTIVSASVGAPSTWYDIAPSRDQPCFPWRLPGSVELGLRLGILGLA